MKAQIVKINPKTVVLKNEKGVFATVSKSRLEFEFKIGDIITLEKNGDEVYFLPSTAPTLSGSNFDFWEESEEVRHEAKRGPRQDEEYNQKAIPSALVAIAAAIIGWFVMFYICFGIGVGCLIYSISNLSNTNSKEKPLAITIIVIAAILLIGELSIAIRNGL